MPKTAAGLLTRISHRRFSGSRPMGSVILSIALSSSGIVSAQDNPQVPAFEVDASWPRLPSEWVLGEVTSIAVDADDHVWLLHRPRTIPEALARNAAPPVIEVDSDGHLLRSWGGPNDRYDWPEREHGIWVDQDENVWISGNGGWPRPSDGGSTDDMLLKFTAQGEFLLQIGQRGASQGNADTLNVHQPGDVFVHTPTNELYVADGYGNQRVIVFDATTGDFKRMWGAFGNTPEAPGEGSPTGADPGAATQFGLVHAVKVSDDGMVYVADRGNRRIQRFTMDGDFIDQVVIDGEAPATPAGFAFSPDTEQEFLYVVESANARILIFDRETMQLIGEFGRRGPEPGGLDIAHHIAMDSEGNLYTAEIVTNRRAQKFVPR